VNRKKSKTMYQNLFLRMILSFFLPFFIIISNTSCSGDQADTPNILIIYVDDLGYADVGCYGARGVSTPNIDRLAGSGLVFTDAHSSAATCTPSRYALLTGSYAFRKKAEVLPGDAPLLIRPGTTTLPSMLKKAGYVTGVVGKWHLGLGIGDVDWNSEIRPGPREIGFDYSFILPATGDRVPCVWVEDGYVQRLDPEDPIRISYDQPIGDDPTGLSHPELLKFRADTQHSRTIVNGISRIGYMSGGHTARWTDENFSFIFLWKAREFIDRNRDRPFLLYLSLHDIHVPRVPNPIFVGNSEMGPRGDVIAQMDWLTGAVIRKLEDSGLTRNTLIIFTSDNGPVLDDGYDDKAVEMVGSHNPSGPFRGGKYSAYEAGTRVPMIVHWPDRIEPGESHALVSQVDLLASLATLARQKLDDSEAPDSKDLLDALLGQSDEGRMEMIEESYTLSLRQGNWKYIRPYSGPVPAWLKNKDIESGLQAEPQLYNLETDPGESKNLAPDDPDRVQQMDELLESIIEGGNNRP
jgi:arylsulfatase A